MSNRKNKKKSSDLLPENCQLEICGASGFGDLMAAAIDPTDNPHGYKIYVLENKKIKPALAEGDRFIARLSRKNDTWWAKPLARTMTAGVALEQIYGVIVEKNGLFYLRSAERNSRMDYLLDKLGSSRVGDFVKVALIGEKKFKQAKIIKNYGRFDIAKSTGLFILEKYKINDSFPDAVVKEASCCPEYHLQGREDLTALPLVTIDGDDSKDFDDAVYAEKTPGGFRLIVAIADVAYYVRPGSELDREAYRRGNSVYLPGMVIPMLPEALSNDLCSLRPKEKRPCLACLMDIDNDGNICRFDFKRAVMKSAARLTYREVQRAFEGTHSLQTMGLFKTVIQPLYEAYFALSKARKKRGTLELDPTEISIKVDNDGHILSLGPAEHFASHEIIEEFMIAANVSAAKRLEQTELPIMFRIHEKPLEEKLKDIEPLLHGLHLKLPDYPALQPGHFNHILEECRRHNLGSGINNLVLRLQCQAKYTPENVGHFGLALSDYVHFTSPIRRYADLLIHRALIKGCGMPDGGELESGADVPQFKEIGEHLCNTERTAVQAERDTLSRYLSAYLEPSIGAKFETKITGLTTAGIFVAIDSLGAEGLIPMHTLPSEKYQFSAGGNEMVGAKTGRRFMMGDRLTACLTEASPISGTLAFKLVESIEDEIRSAGKSSRLRRKAAGRQNRNFRKKNARKKSNKTITRRSKSTMMNKLIGVSLLCLSLSFPAQADDRLTLAEIYQTVQDEYLEPVSLNEIAMPALQGLNKLDKRVRIADDDRRVSVYVNGRVMLSRSKPEDPHDVSAWVKFTQDIIQSAQKASPELKRKDFEIIDTMMAHGIKKFDRDSSYYPDLELSNPPVPEFKPKRAFYDRLLENDVLYMRLGAINKYTGENVSRSLTEHSGVKGVIIDLRGNPGGMLQEAVRVAGLFIDGGIVASSKGRSPDSTEYYNAPAGDVLDNKPIVVLIDGQTASSAEVLAAALQEQSRAVVVGTGSYGKGTVQKLIKLSNNSRLALTNGIIYTPSGNKLAGIGVLPDICTSGEPETRDAEKIIARGSRSNACLPENRMKSELDLSVAEAYLRKHIK